MGRFCEECIYSDVVSGNLHCMGQKYMPIVDRHDTCDDWKPDYKTNADKYFRNATDEELAERLSKQNFWNCPPHGETCPGYCRECWLDWLKQEVSDED